MSTTITPTTREYTLTGEQYLAVMRLVRDYGHATAERVLAVNGTERIEPGGDRWNVLYRRGEALTDQIMDILLGRPSY